MLRHDHTTATDLVWYKFSSRIMSNLTIVTFATKITSKWNMFRLLHGYRSLNKYIYCVWKPLQRYAAGAARFRQVNALYAAHLSSISIGLRSRAILVWLPQAWSAESISWYGGRLGAARIQKGNQFSTFHRIPVHSSLNSGSKEMRLYLIISKAWRLAAHAARRVRPCRITAFYSLPPVDDWDAICNFVIVQFVVEAYDFQFFQ